VGVRAYSQTTGVWLRGILAESYDLRAHEVVRVTLRMRTSRNMVTRLGPSARQPVPASSACCGKASSTPSSSAMTCPTTQPCAPCLPTPEPRPRRSARARRLERSHDTIKGYLGSCGATIKATYYLNGLAAQPYLRTVNCWNSARSGMAVAGSPSQA
jgi:hypothetical protein